ncbi:MAG TPA: DHA2 family efflux MFS transporter permease subunit, partial [Puia sp.]|nr:DHA2 family efflux MFS transporter permease subunit [Puia sp.]
PDAGNDAGPGSGGDAGQDSGGDAGNFAKPAGVPATPVGSVVVDPSIGRDGTELQHGGLADVPGKPSWKGPLVLITLMAGTSMAAIDTSIVNVSLPVIRNQFRVDIDEVEWVVTAYMISFCLFLPLISWLKSRIGYFWLFVSSVAIFTLGSLLCSLSDNLVMLVIARVLQASGGGAISPTSLAILSENFPKEKRGSAIGWWGIGNVMGPAIGPTLGGVLTHYFGWQSVFYVNIPIGIVTIGLALKYLGFLRAQPRVAARFDLAGYASFALFIISVQYTVSLVSRNELLSWRLLSGLTVLTAALYLFIRSSRRPQPLLDLSVFRSKDFINSSVIIVIRSIALFGGMFFLPFLLQGLLGYTEIQSGLLMLPNALMMLVSRPYAGKKADEGLIRNISIAGIVLVAVSMFLFSRIQVGFSIVLIILPMLVRGLGMSLLVAPVSTAMLNSVSLPQTATATSLNSLLQQSGGSLGIALFGVLHNFIYQHYLQKHTAPIAEHFALQDGFLIAGFVIALAFIPAIRLPEKHFVRHKDAAAGA